MPPTDINRGPLSHAGFYTRLGDEIPHVYFTNRSVKLLLIKQAQDKADPGPVQLWFKGVTLRVPHGRCYAQVLSVVEVGSLSIKDIA